MLADPARYVAAEQVADLAVAVFHEFVSLSIQHLVNEIGIRMLDRWPQLAEVSFDAQNRLWDVGAESGDDPRVKSYADPRPPFGHIGLVLRRRRLTLRDRVHRALLPWWRLGRCPRASRFRRLRDKPLALLPIAVVGPGGAGMPGPNPTSCASIVESKDAATT